MAAISDDFRARAKQQAEASIALFDSADFDAKPKTQALAIIGQVNATLYTALADMADYLRTSAGADRLSARTGTLLKRNDAIRQAAAKGDWVEFDKLVNGTSDPAAEPAPVASGT